MVKEFISTLPALQQCLEQLGIQYPYCWLGLNFETKLLLGKKYLSEVKIGEIDILGSPVSWLACTPDLERIFAIKVKKHRVKIDSFGNLRKKSSNRFGRSQAYHLAEIGFNKVLLLHLVVTKRLYLSNQNPWFLNLLVANEGAEQYTQLVGVNENTPYGFIIMGWGQVPFEKIEIAGSVSLIVVKNIIENPLLQAPEVINRRNALIQTLSTVFQKANNPSLLPLYLKNCDKCKNLFLRLTNSIKKIVIVVNDIKCWDTKPPSRA